ncbi:DNA polymerase III subunit delta' [Halalkalibacter hemicellulosilyticus]|uniref:DNA polymerase III subunit delta' n=1 Tax=Halalkalibacter hemicellulosilyticusJCM 9152 TaxID=1236971 RepID=W4QIH8_9BACI|nr:DNA polymerase III subunit delta' [Halalkalibacter hemicellulosilyticus]GAE31722.1 DNA polymerase III delta prime subunit [Halalkalibacter hemicellulosilyticusJCM 9152]
MKTWQQLAEIQPRVIDILMRTLQKNRLAHAYLFEGSKGTGKKDVALQLAKSFFCESLEETEPCQQCLSCRRIEHGNHPDVHIIEPDGQSIKKQQIEHLQKEFAYRGVESIKKVYIVGDADKMTASAANSILKFLEEPNGTTLAVLMTEQGKNILPTIQSRSQLLSFAPLAREPFIQFLINEGISRTNAHLLASLTTSFDQVKDLVQEDWIAQARSVVIQLMEELYGRPSQLLFTIQEKWLGTFKDKAQQEIGLDMLLLWFRDLLFAKLGNLNTVSFIDQVDSLEKQALQSSQERLSRHMAAVLEAKKQLHANVNPQLVMEKLMLSIQEG